MVLDPSCGSGTFLFHCVKTIKNRIRKKHHGKLKDASKIAAMLVHGIDIHPIAVEMSKTTMRIALGETIEPHEYNIALGNSMNIKDNYQGPTIPTLNDTDNIKIPTTVKCSYIEIPHKLYNHKNLRDIIEKIKNYLLLNDQAYKEQQAKTNKIVYDKTKILEELNMYIDTSKLELSKTDIDYFVQSLFSVIEKQDNHVWCWYLQNMATLINLNKNKISRLVGNPPWQVLNKVKQERRKKEIKEIALREKVYNKEKKSYLANVDLASVFSARVTRLYLSEENGRYGWVLPGTSIIGQTWKNWRKGQWSDDIWVEHQEMWVLNNVKPPIFKHSPNGCSVVLGSRVSSKSKLTKPIIKVYSGDYDNDPPVVEGEWKNRCSSPYLKRAAMGVMYRPLCYYQIVIDKDQKKTSKKLCSIKPESFGEGKNWEGCGYEGVIEKNALLPLIDSKQLTKLKGLHYEPNLWLIAPLEDNQISSIEIFGDEFQQGLMTSHIPPQQLMLTYNEKGDENERREKKYPKLHAYWKKCNEQYKKRRDKKRSAEYLEFNYRFKILLENELNKCRIYGQQKIKVVYNASGSTLRAIRVPANIMTSSKIYYILCDTEKEAQYLVGVFNAPIMQSIWRKTQTSNHDYVLSPLRSVPIPKFNSKDEIHLGIADEVDRLEKLPNPIEKNKKINFDGLNPWLEQLLPDYVCFKHVFFD